MTKANIIAESIVNKRLMSVLLILCKITGFAQNTAKPLHEFKPKKLHDCKHIKVSYI